MSENKIKYLNILAERLKENYHLSAENAHHAVFSSVVEQMMHDDKDAEWQMHQPVDDTAEEIYCQYKGIKTENVY